MGSVASLIGVALFLWLFSSAPQEAADQPSVSTPAVRSFRELASRNTSEVLDPRSAGRLRGGLSVGAKDRPQRFRRKFRDLSTQRDPELEADPDFERLLALDATRKMALVDQSDREQLKQALAEMKAGPPIERRVLEKALRDPSSEVRLAALYEISVTMDRPPIDWLAPMVEQDPDPEVRLEALGMIAESEEEKATAVIRTALNDPDPRVRMEAAELLEERDASL